MRAYSSSENHLFFGRDAKARELEESLRTGARELILSGSSGCGKTSLVQAGLIPRLSAPPLDASAYSVATLSAEPDPLVALERAVRDFDSRRRMLLVIDTLETVLTLPPAEQRSFFDTLSLLRTGTKLQFLFVLSSEFQDLFDPSLSPWLAKAPSVPLEPLRDQQLARALTEPARAVGIELEPALVTKLCDDAAQEPGAMPLLQFTMGMLWRNLNATTLRLEAYQRLTEQQGLGSAARLHAQKVLSESAAPHLAMRILLRLVHFCYGRPHTRYRRAEHELLDDLERERPSLKHLVDSGLVTHVGLSYDLAHDTLIHSWAELSRYVTEHAEDEKERRTWQARAESGRDRGGGLLDLEDLHAAEAWHKRAAATVGCSPLLADYLEESRRAIQEQQRRADLTQARQYLAQAQSHLQGARGAKAAPYLVAARELLDTHAALGLPERLLFGWARRSLPHTSRAVSLGDPSLPPFPQPAASPPVASHAGDRRAVIEDGSLRIEPLEPDSQPLQLGRATPDATLVWSADDRFLLSFERSCLELWRTSAPPPPTSSDCQHGPRPERLDRVPECVKLASWAPDRAYLAIAGAEDRTLRIWNAVTRKPVSPLFETLHPITHLAWRRTNEALHLLALCEGHELLVWDSIDSSSPSDRRRAECRKHVPFDATSPDGALRATAEGKRVRITSSGRAHAPELDHLQPVTALAWSPCSQCLATITSEGAIRIWDATMGYQVQLEQSVRDRVVGITWNDDQLAITTEKGSHPLTLHLDPTDLADWRAAAAKSPYHLVDGVLLRKEPTAP